MNASQRPAPPWDALRAELSALTVPRRISNATGPNATTDQQLALSRVRLAALVIAANGNSFDQSDFLSIPPHIEELREHECGHPNRDGTLCGRALAAMIERGLPLSHPLVREMLTSDVPAERKAVASAIDPSDELGRSLLALLYNDNIDWVREVARRKLAPFGVAPWTGLFSNNPYDGADERTRAAVDKIIEALSVADRTAAEQAAQDSLRPSLDALDDDRLVDLCATAIDGSWLQRPSTPTIFTACRDRALLGRACERSGHLWLDHWDTLARGFQPIESLPRARRAPMQLAMFRALARAYAHPSRKESSAQRWAQTSGVIDGEPWRHEPRAWIDAIHALWDCAEAREFVRAVACRIQPEFIDAELREACVSRWIDGDPGSWQAFEAALHPLSLMVEPMQREKARAFARRATESAHAPARTWGLHATLSSLWDEGDEPRDALAARYFSDPTHRALALSDRSLTADFVAPLRGALVSGELREWTVIEELGQTVMSRSALGVLVDLTMFVKKSDTTLPPLDRWAPDERAAFERHRRARFEAALVDGDVCGLLESVPSKSEWSAEDAKLVDEVMQWARGGADLFEKGCAFILGAALGACDDAAYADLAQKLLERDGYLSRFDALCRPLRALAAKVAPAKSSRESTVHELEQGWDDDD